MHFTLAFNFCNKSYFTTYDDAYESDTINCANIMNPGLFLIKSVSLQIDGKSCKTWVNDGRLMIETTIDDDGSEFEER